MEKILTTNVTARRVAIWTATIILVLLGFEFLWLIRNVIFLVFLSVLLATGIEPVVRWLRKGPFNKGTGILAVYTLIFGIMALIVFLTVPPLIEEGRGLVDRFTNPDNIKASIASIDNGLIKSVATTVYDNAGTFLQGLKIDASAVTVVFPVFET